MESDESLENAVVGAQEKKLVEPGSVGCLGLINREINDCLFKTCIVADSCFMPPNKSVGVSSAINPDDIMINYLNEGDLDRLRKVMRIHRFIVTFSRSCLETPDAIGGFRFRTFNGWEVVAGFRDVRVSSSFSTLVVPVHFNSALVCTSNGDEYYMCGPGAGPVPTATAMMQDACRLLGIR